MALQALVKQFKQASEVLTKQAEVDKKELAERLALETDRFVLDVDKDLNAQAKQLDEETNSAIMRLQKNAALEKAQLDQQASSMIQVYETQKAEEDMQKRQSEIQRQYTTSQNNLNKQSQGLQERANAYSRLQAEQGKLKASALNAQNALMTALSASQVVRQSSAMF